MVKSPITNNGGNHRPTQCRLFFVVSLWLLLSPQLFAAQVVLNGMPIYTWWYGCTPTSGGMLVGYWDAQGYDFVPGDISTFNADAQNMISSPEHLADYWVGPAGSTAPDPFPAGTHADNCLADFMKTSRSGLVTPGPVEDGGTWTTYHSPGLIDFASYVGLNFFSESYYTPEIWAPGTFNFNSLKSEIDAGRPMLINTQVPGGGHSIAVDGYKDNGVGDQWIAVHDTWGDGIGGTSATIGATTDGTNEWWPWLTNTSGSFYVYGGVTFGASAPEPSTLILFSMGALLLRRRQQILAKV